MKKIILPLGAKYEVLEGVIPEVLAMKGFDQLSDYHDLTLDEHSKEVVRHMSRNSYIKNHPKKDLILLSARLHDIGKLSPKAQQAHPKNPQFRTYIGHEAESERMIRQILPRYFELCGEDVEFVSRLAGLHSSAINLVRNFKENHEPQRKALSAYSHFFEKVKKIPGNDLDDSMRIIFAMNRADKMSGWNRGSDQSSPKVIRIVTKSLEALNTLALLEKALPAIMIAVSARENGDQKAGIVCESGRFRYLPPEERAHSRYLSFRQFQMRHDETPAAAS